MPASEIEPANALLAADALSEESHWWQQWRDARDPQSRDHLLSLHLPYAKTVAATYYRRRMHNEIEFGDYLQYAHVGLLEAMERYDPGLGAQFRTFAARRMHGSILNGIERLTEKQQQIALRQRLRHERAQAVKAASSAADAKLGSAGDPTAGSPKSRDLFRYLADVGIGLALCRLLEGTGMVDDGGRDQAHATERHYEPVELAQLRRRIVGMVHRLPAQERTVITYHYLQDHSFEEIGGILGVGRSRVAQIHRHALGQLRAQLSAEASCDVSL
jgi:RNA polymerase sigma factor for flagellar operon FliA